MVMRYNTMQQADWTFAGNRWQKPKPIAKPATVAKPVAVDPRLTELRRLEAQNAELRRCIPLAAEYAQLKAEHARLQQRLDERTKPRKGVRFSQGGFNVGKGNRPAA